MRPAFSIPVSLLVTGITAAGVLAAGPGRAASQAAPVIALTPDAPGRGRPADAVLPPEPGGQTLGVTVPVGPLVLIRSPGTIQLHRVGSTSRFEATHAGLRLADARGSDAGWKLRMTFIAVDDEGSDGSRLHLAVRRVDAFAETIDGISAASSLDLHPSQSAVLVRAVPGSGAGAWDVTLDITADLPGVDAKVTTARVRFDAV